MINIDNRKLVEVSLKVIGLKQSISMKRKIVRYKKSLFDIIFKKPGIPIYEYIIEHSPFVEDEEIRALQEKAFSKLESHIYAGETINFYIVGFTDSQRLIKDSDINVDIIESKLSEIYKCSKSGYILHYINGTDESYREQVPKSRIFLKEISMNAGMIGHNIQYSTSMLKRRAIDLEVDIYPIIDRFFINSEEDGDKILQEYKDAIVDKGIPDMIEVLIEQ